MAQGAHKLSSKANSGGRKDTGKMRKGKRVIAPKNKQRVQEAAQKRQLSAKINDSIEKQMVKAASGGKLTIMRGVGEVEPGAGKSSKSKDKPKGKK